ncbi:hypothetical protein OC861_000890 [Tilletia horrida]|nr:hypothetical protein OC861_000890 [Tilletia horrida]
MLRRWSEERISEDNVMLSDNRNMMHPPTRSISVTTIVPPGSELETAAKDAPFLDSGLSSRGMQDPKLPSEEWLPAGRKLAAASASASSASSSSSKQ